VLAAITLPAILAPGAVFDPWNAFLPAAIVGGLAAWWTKSIGAAILVGLPALWLLTWLIDSVLA
jgi:branched-subunit amino acid transport protein